MRIVFAGTPEFAATALAALHAAGHEIVLVLTQPDRPSGRGMQLHASAVKQFATQHHIPVLQPISLRLDGKYPDQAGWAHEILKSTPHEVMIVVAYGLILPESVLVIPPLGCLNIHASLLPRWRGAAPVHRAIEAGDADTGITIMQMDQGLDTGPMLSEQRIAITDNDTTGTLHNKLATLGGEMIIAVLQQIMSGKPTAHPQPTQGISYASKISKEEAWLDFNLPAIRLARKIRAFNPVPGAQCLIDNLTYKIWNAVAVARPANAETGRFLLQDRELLIPCEEGALKVLELQKPGGKRLVAREFLKSYTRH